MTQTKCSQPQTTEDLMTAKQVAIYLSVSIFTLQRMRTIGTGPPYRRLSRRCIRYHRKDVEKWVEEISKKNA